MSFPFFFFAIKRLSDTSGITWISFPSIYVATYTVATCQWIEYDIKSLLSREAISMVVSQRRINMCDNAFNHAKIVLSGLM